MTLTPKESTEEFLLFPDPPAEEKELDEQDGGPDDELEELDEFEEDEEEEDETENEKEED